MQSHNNDPEVSMKYQHLDRGIGISIAFPAPKEGLLLLRSHQV